MELRRWKTCLKQLGDVNSRLVKEGEVATLRIESLAHPDLAINPRHNPIISCKDAAFSRSEDTSYLYYRPVSELNLFRAFSKMSFSSMSVF